jgi:dUTPase
MIQKCWVSDLLAEETANKILKQRKESTIMKILIKKKDNNKYPKKMTDKAAAFDVFCTGVEEVATNKYICHTNLHMKPPTGYKICLVPRSSLSNTNWVLGNHFGIGEEDYTNEYQFRFTGIPTGISVMQLFQGKNIFTYDEFPYKEGDRIGQIFLSKVVPTELDIVEKLPATKSNRKGGFGSTGK